MAPDPICPLALWRRSAMQTYDRHRWECIRSNQSILRSSQRLTRGFEISQNMKSEISTLF